MDLPTPQGTPDEMRSHDAKPQFNVVIAYEDFATGKHAQETYDYLARSLHPELKLDNQMWKFEVLGNPALRDLASKDAADADLIMISTHGDGALPREVKDWIDDWAGNLCSTMALVKLTDRTRADQQGEDLIRAYLQAVARRAGVDFFAQPDQWPQKDEHFSPQQISERTKSTSTLMDFFTHGPMHSHFWKH